jgi:hypothetical protein
MSNSHNQPSNLTDDPDPVPYIPNPDAARLIAALIQSPPTTIFA